MEQQDIYMLCMDAVQIGLVILIICLIKFNAECTEYTHIHRTTVYNYQFTETHEIK